MNVLEPYRFSVTDARKTLTHAIELLDATPVTVHAALASRRRAIADALGRGLDGHDPNRANVDNVWATLEVVWPLLCDLRTDLTASPNLLPTRQQGDIVRLATSEGGVPKSAVDSCDIGWSGVVGDVQKSRQHHGRPWQAVCLWSAEVLAALTAEGHPIVPGGVGENVLVAGVDWSDVWPGVRLGVGDAELEVTASAVPCQQIAFNFVDGDFRRIASERGPVARVYARVVRPGPASTGDPFVVEP